MKMVDQYKYPFALTDVFFTSFHCDRQPEVPDPISLSVIAYVRVELSKYPNLEIFLKLQTDETKQLGLHFDAEAVGKFSLVPNATVPDKNIISPFIDERALFILWPVIAQQIKQMTALMGMNPIRLAMPYNFATPVDIDVPEGLIG